MILVGSVTRKYEPVRLSDLTLKLDGTEFRVHKFPLATLSGYFKVSERTTLIIDEPLFFTLIQYIHLSNNLLFLRDDIELRILK